MPQNYNWLLIFPLGILFIYLLEEQEEQVEIHTLVEQEDSWLVKTQNYEAKKVDTVKPNADVTITFGQTDNKPVIKSIEYNKDRYSEEDVRRLIKERLVNCKRCRKA